MIRRPRPRRVASAAVLTVLGMLLAGCHGGEVGSDPSNPDQVEVLTGWTSGVERTGLQALFAEFERQNPGIETIDASVKGGAGAAARRALDERLAAGNPPDAFLTAAGGSLAGYVAAGQVRDLNSVLSPDALAAYPPALLDALTVDGILYAAPASVSRVNIVWTNNVLLRSAGLDPSDPPQTLDAWLADLEQVRSAGTRYPLAIGRDWTQVLLVETVLLGELGPDDYRGLFDGATPWDDPRVASAVDGYAALLDFTDPAAGATSGPAATQRVVDGDAAYVVMGDGAQAAFQSAGFTFRDQFTAFPVPGTRGTFDLLVQAFALPSGAAHPDAAERWLQTVASADGERVLATALGSIPARADTVAVDYPEYQQSAISSFQQDQLVPSLALGVAADPSWTADITSAVDEFHSRRSADALVAALVRAADARLP